MPRTKRAHVVPPALLARHCRRTCATRQLCSSLTKLLRDRSIIAGVGRASALVFLALSLQVTAVAAAPRAEPVVVAKIRVGTGPCLMEAAFGYVWVANNAGSTLTRVDPRTNRARGGLRIGENPCGIPVHCYPAGAGDIRVDCVVDELMAERQSVSVFSQ